MKAKDLGIEHFRPEPWLEVPGHCTKHNDAWVTQIRLLIINLYHPNTQDMGLGSHIAPSPLIRAMLFLSNL
jgi:hypothetical protein